MEGGEISLTGMSETKGSRAESLQLKNIEKPGDLDVMCGRGAGTNNHVGNKTWRDMVEARKEEYHVRSNNGDKKKISGEIVEQIRGKNGRFLKLNKETGKWDDVGDKAAQEKTKQALRERDSKLKGHHDYLKAMLKKGQRVTENLTRGISVPKVFRVASKRANQTRESILERSQSVTRYFKDFRSTNPLPNAGNEGFDLSSPRERKSTPDSLMPDFSPPRERTSTSGSLSCSDAAAAKWCSGSIGSSMNSNASNPTEYSGSSTNQYLPPIATVNQTSPRLARPEVVKRVTSNWNESDETKPSRVKKAALNRDHSAVANRLKMQHIPECFNLRMENLRLSNSESRTVETVPHVMVPSDRPPPINTSDRLNTHDILESELLQEFSPKASIVTNGSPHVVSSGRSSLITSSNGTNIDDRPLPINTRLETYDTVELGILNTISVSERTNASLVTNDSPNVASSDRSSLITPSNGTSTLLQPLPINIRMKTCDAVELDNMLSSVLATDSPCVVSLERPARISTSDRTETNGTI